MKISLFVHDLSNNPVVRAVPFARAMQKLGYEVEFLGLTFNSDEVYEPFKEEFVFKTVRSYYDIRWVIINSFKLSKLATGDIAYAFKPLWSSLFPAMLFSKLGLKKRLILDAEDNELHDAFIGNGLKSIIRSPYYPINPVYNKILHPYTYFIKRKTVANRKLQIRYGGTLVLHGPDSDHFNPTKFASREILRRKYKIPVEVNTLLFAGKPVFYNGLDFLIRVLSDRQLFGWHLILVGKETEQLFQLAKSHLGERCHLLGFVSNTKMPEILKMSDIVPVIQTPCPSTFYQTPAKLLEAMAMEKGIIVSDIEILKNIIDEQTGWKIPANDDAAFKEALVEIQENPILLQQKGIKAREYFLANASVSKISESIQHFFCT